jgi:hypothetical protein
VAVASGTPLIKFLDGPAIAKTVSADDEPPSCVPVVR